MAAESKTAWTDTAWELMPPGYTDELGNEHSFSVVRVAPNRYIVCEGRSEAEANANAALCSKAPELVEALTVLVNAADECPKAFVGDFVNDDMRALLQQIRGEA